MSTVNPRALALFLLVILLALAACAPAPTPIPPTVAPTAVPPTKAPEPTKAPAATVAPTTAPAATTAPTAAPTTAAAATAAPTRARVRLSIVTGGTGGVYYPYGGGLASLISKNVANTEAAAEVTSASVDNMKLIQTGKADVAFTLADTLFDAYDGRGPFQATGKVPVRALAVLYSNYTHIVVTEDSGIKTVAELKGKRVSVGSAGSGTEIIANRILEAAGLNPDSDIKRERLGVAESAGAMKDKKIDAFFWSGGLPTAAVLDLVGTPGQKIRFLASADLIGKLTDKYGPFYFKLTMPKTAYPGMDADVDVAGVANLLIVNEKFDASLAYDILKTMVDKKADLGAIHAEAKNFGLPQATVGSPIPFHPGAIKLYAEKGITVK
ncbi:MAG: TAXI family TRAP transporter solute-binding subunit [Chloroflexi bacterium]|nr:TAXI family TRAP transporter solute-binding subunit [Chloroflexota bacterium]